MNQKKMRIDSFDESWGVGTLSVPPLLSGVGMVLVLTQEFVESGNAVRVSQHCHFTALPFTALLADK